MKELTLSRGKASELLKLAQDAPDRRVCGLALGKHHGEHAEITRILPLQNTSNDPQAHSFDAAALQAAADSADEELIAVYHSQPDLPPLPGPDAVQACPVQQTHLLVISLNIKGVLEMRAFARDGDQVTETPIRIFLS